MKVSGGGVMHFTCRTPLEMEFSFFSLYLLPFLLEDFCSYSDFIVWNIYEQCLYCLILRNIGVIFT